jgi:uncharacterized membrane protein
MKQPTIYPQLKSEKKWELSNQGKRALLKTLTWRIAGSTSTFTIAYLMTGSIGLSSGIAVVQMFVNTFLYWVHESIWDKLPALHRFKKE